MEIACQQKDIFKIRDKVPGHGLQEVIKVDNYIYKKVILKCGCYVPFSYLPKKEQEMIMDKESYVTHN